MTGPDLSIVMPCLNEETTVGFCVEDAKAFMTRRGLSGEIIVVDNGSTDRSAEIAQEHGASVIPEWQRGYGYALRCGIAAAKGKVILMGDCDTTYDFRSMDGLYDPLAQGKADMMIGNRFESMKQGTMTLIHRAGVHFLSAIGRRRYSTDIQDFHCGLRGMTAEAANRLPFRTGGMEFATEMIVLATQANLRVGQCPVTLRRCTFPRKSKLRILPDGIRHLKYILNNKH